MPKDILEEYDLLTDAIIEKCAPPVSVPFIPYSEYEKIMKKFSTELETASLQLLAYMHVTLPGILDSLIMDVNEMNIDKLKDFNTRCGFSPFAVFHLN